MFKYPKKTQNVITHYVKTLPSNVIPKFPPLYIEFLKYYFNEQIEENNSTNSNNGSINSSSDVIKDTLTTNNNNKTSLHRNSNGHITNDKRNSSNSSLSTFAYKNTSFVNNSSIPLSRTKSIPSTYNNSINSVPSSYSETSSYYYNNHKRSLPGNLCLITKSQEFNEIQITLRELFLDVYNDDLLSQYFYPIFIDFSHENIFALWLKEDDDNDNYHSSKGSPYWGFQTGLSNSKHNSLMKSSNLLSCPIIIGQLPIVKIGLEKQRIGVIAKNLNSFLSLLTQTSFVNNVVRNYRIGGGDESTILSSEGSSDEEYNSIQDMMRYDGDFFESEITSESSSTVSLDEVHHKISENGEDLIDTSFLDENNEDDENTKKNTLSKGKNSQSQEETNEQFTLEIESNEGDDEKDDLDDEFENKSQDFGSDITETNKIEAKKEKENYEANNENLNSVEEPLKTNNEIIYIETSETDEDKKNITEEVKSNVENSEHKESDNETLSSSVADIHNRHSCDFGYDSDVKIDNKDYLNAVINDNSLPNSFPYRRYTDDFDRMNKSEFGVRRYSYASSMNSTLTTVSASPFAIRTMFQQQETQMAYNQWFDEICKRDNIKLDNSDEIEKKLLQEDSVLLRSASISSSRSNQRKYYSMDGYSLNHHDNKSNSIRTSKNNSFIQGKYNQRPLSLWDSILDKNRQTAMVSSPSEKYITINVENTNEKGANMNELPPSSESDILMKHKLHKKSSNKLSVKSISHTLSKSASAAPKQIKRKLKENASLQKLKIMDSKLKNKESLGHLHSSQKSPLYSKKLMNNNDLISPTSSALSKNISSSSSRTKVSSPLSQNRKPENYLKPRKNVPTTVTTMMTISNNLNHTHNSSIVSKTSPKIPSKLHQNISVNRYRTNSSPAPIYTPSNRMINKDYMKQNVSKMNSNNNESTDNKENSNINANLSTPNSNHNENNMTKTETPSTTPNASILQINSTLSKKESKDSLKLTPSPFENTIFGNLFSAKKFPKFNGFNFFTSIPIVAKLLNLDTKEAENNSNTSKDEEKKDATNKPTADSKNNLPINISQQGNNHTTIEKSPEKSTLSTLTNNSGTINYISSATLASQILEKERKGIPEPEQWLQKQVKARAYAIAVANAVAKRNNSQKNNDYSQYTTKFTPTNHVRKHPHNAAVLPTADILNKEIERRKFMEDEDYFIL